MSGVRCLLYVPPELLPGLGSTANPSPDALPELLDDCAALVWWAVGEPLRSGAAPCIVTDHIRLFAGTPALTGPHFVPMDAPYAVELGRQLAQQLGMSEWQPGVVADVPNPAALSLAERAMLDSLGASWAVGQATAATLHARRLRRPVVGLVSDATIMQNALRTIDLARLCDELIEIRRPLC